MTVGPLRIYFTPEVSPVSSLGRKARISLELNFKLSAKKDMEGFIAALPFRQIFRSVADDFSCKWQHSLAHANAHTQMY